MTCSRCKRLIGRDDNYITQQDVEGTKLFCSAGCQVRVGQRPDISFVPNPSNLPIRPQEAKESRIVPPIFPVAPLEVPRVETPKPQGNVVDLRNIRK